MDSMVFLLRLRHLIKTKSHITRRYSDHAPSKIRNIGIIAHIDAGKTTTTERMLYHAGAIRHMGNVDSGNTVTDFLPSERARGITVQNAAVTIDWKGTTINVVDTPGHVDFTTEVESSLHVMDGAVAILDASRGVEAQTRTVWRQANKLNVPRIAFVNKMDKPAADFFATVRTMQDILSANTLVTQIPVSENGFQGAIDLVNLSLLKWESGTQEKSVSSVTKLSKSANADLWEESLTHRRRLIEKLADSSDDIAELYLTDYSDDVSNFPTAIIENGIKVATAESKIVPVLCGSAFNNIGVDWLMDAITKYLPSPLLKHDLLASYRGSLLGYAFKVMHHKKLGPIVFIRIYSGNCTPNMEVYNFGKDCSEKISQIFTIFAEEYHPKSIASEGQIVAVTGLKHATAGDTILSSKSEVEDVPKEVLAPVAIPTPVFFCTVETDSPTQLKVLKTALGIITREDPSVHVRKDENSGQLILSGMGELHLEVVVERLKTEFKIKCYIGPVQVAYREQPTKKIRQNLSYSRAILHHKRDLKMSVTVQPSPHDGVRVNTAQLNVPPEVRVAIKEGVLQACSSGVIMGYPLIRTQITIHSFEMTTNSPASVISAAAVNMTLDLLREALCQVLEPIMKVEIVTDAEKLPLVLRSLSQKHADVLEVSGDNQERCVSAKAPVGEMLGYASKLRTIASGNADLTMEVIGYEATSRDDIKSAFDDDSQGYVS